MEMFTRGRARVLVQAFVPYTSQEMLITGNKTTGPHDAASAAAAKSINV